MSVSGPLLSIKPVKNATGPVTITIFVSDGAGAELGVQFTLTIGGPMVLEQPKPSYTAKAGATLAIKYLATSKQIMYYQWYFINSKGTVKTLQNGPTISGVNRNELVLKQIQKKEAGTYAAVAINKYGQVLSRYTQVIVK
jgi:hypothetical protein